MVPFQLRLSDELHGRLKEAARVGRRSLQAEILVRLEVSLVGGAMSSPGYPVVEEPEVVVDRGFPVLASEGSQRRLLAENDAERARPKRKARTEMCVHRVSPGGYCKVCDA